MGSRTQILKCKVLLKGIEFDFPLCKELKIDRKLPKNQFSFFSIIWKIENWIENCQKINFQFFSLSKKLNWKLPITNFHFFVIIESLTKMKWTFSYTDALSNWKTSFKSKFRFSMKIEKWISVCFLTKSFLCPSTPLISCITTLPLKNEYFHLFSIFQPIENEKFV